VSVREVARRARISEAVVYQRYPTKAHLFFAATVPQTLHLEGLVAAPGDGLSVAEKLEEIALVIMGRFREVPPILVQLATHPDFDLGQLARHHPESAFCHNRQGLVQLLESQRAPSKAMAGDVAPGSLTPVCRPAQPGFPRASGRAWGQV